MTFGPLTTDTFTLLVGLGVVLSVALAAWGYARRAEPHPGRAVDAYLLALIFGLVGARIVHVALHWDYFSANTGEISRLAAGGLDPYGAVVAGLFGLWLGARLRGARFITLLDSLAPALPLIAFMAWWGCAANHCAYGTEVDNLAYYPSWLVWEERDVYNIILPRYAVQPLGMVASAALLITLPGLFRLARRSLPGSRFALALALLALSGFVLGFLRGDAMPVYVGLRAEQWLALVTASGASAAALRHWRMVRLWEKTPGAAQ